jgi:hypothetical protein
MSSAITDVLTGGPESLRLLNRARSLGLLADWNLAPRLADGVLVYFVVVIPRARRKDGHVGHRLARPYSTDRYAMADLAIIEAAGAVRAMFPTELTEETPTP